MSQEYNAFEWHSELVKELSIPQDIAAELSKQLVVNAQALAGVALDDGYHAFLSPGPFVVQYRDVGGSIIASVEGDIVGPDAIGHTAIVAWRSATGADLRLTPERGAADLEFFWLSLPVAELRHPERIDASGWLKQNRFGFEVEVELYTLRDISLRLMALTTFSDDEVGTMVEAVAAAIRAWNERGLGLVHYCSEPKIARDRRMVKFHVDLGGGQLDALAEILRSVDSSPVCAAVAKCCINGDRAQK